MTQPPLRLDDFRRLAQFRELTTAELRPLLGQGLVWDFPAGAVVFRQGEEADHLLLVLTGQLRAWAEVDENSEPVATVYAGELVGEAALFRSAGLRTVTLKAVLPTRVLRLDRAALDRMQGERVLAVLQRQMLSSTARRLRNTNHAMRRVWRRAHDAHPNRAEGMGAAPSLGEDTPASRWTRFLQALGSLV